MATGACGPSFEARKSAHLRMTTGLVARLYVSKNPPSTVTTLPVM